MARDGEEGEMNRIEYEVGTKVVKQRRHKLKTVGMTDYCASGS